MPLCDSKNCYLCKKLTSKQITDRKGRFKYYSNKIEKGMKERTDMKQPGYLNNQLEANLASRIRLQPSVGGEEVWVLPTLMGYSIIGFTRRVC